MGANVTYRVKVLKTTEEWVEVSAVVDSEAKEIAERLPGVIRVLEVVDSYYVEEENNV